MIFNIVYQAKHQLLQFRWKIRSKTKVKVKKTTWIPVFTSLSQAETSPIPLQTGWGTLRSPAKQRAGTKNNNKTVMKKYILS
jgi:hypothetical protein